MIGLGVSLLSVKDRLVTWWQVLLTERPGDTSSGGGAKLERGVDD